MNHKGSLELSINTLVVVIISVVILSSGVTLLYKFITSAEETKLELDARTIQAIEKMLIIQGKPVALPFHAAKVEREELHTFGLGILSIYPEQTTFKIVVVPVKLLNEIGEEIDDRESLEKSLDWITYDSEPFVLNENEHKKISLFVAPEDTTKLGTYIFTVKVLTPLDGNQVNYGTVQKMYVTVT